MISLPQSHQVYLVISAKRGLREDRRRSPMMTQVPWFSDAGPLSVGSVHCPSRPSHTRNVFHFAKGLWPEEECLFPPSLYSLT